MGDQEDDKKHKYVAGQFDLPQSFIEHLYRTRSPDWLVDRFGGGSFSGAEARAEIIRNQKIARENEPISLAEYIKLKKEDKID